MLLGPSLAKGKLVAPWFAASAAQHRDGPRGDRALLPGATKPADRPLRIPVVSGLDAGLACPDPRAARGAFWWAHPFFNHFLRHHVVYCLAFSFSPWPSAALIGIFYISTFLDLSDKVFKGDATWAQLGRVHRLSSRRSTFFSRHSARRAGCGAFVTVGVLTKNNELIVMKACSISLYRIALPMVVLRHRRRHRAVRASKNPILGPFSNRRAERLQQRHPRPGSPAPPALAIVSGSSARASKMFSTTTFIQSADAPHAGRSGGLRIPSRLWSASSPAHVRRAGRPVDAATPTLWHPSRKAGPARSRTAVRLGAFTPFDQTRSDARRDIGGSSASRPMPASWATGSSGSAPPSGSG